jgi:hypothetical protein
VIFPCQLVDRIRNPNADPGKQLNADPGKQLNADPDPLTAMARKKVR